MALRLHETYETMTPVNQAPTQASTLERPVAPSFPLRHFAWVAYAMSVGTGALGQVLFLGSEFGGKSWSYLAAIGLAAFAEVVMCAAGDASLDHRANRRAWKPLLFLGITVACYAASMNLFHFFRANPALAWTFGGASMVGFLLHILDGHIRVVAYLRADEEFRTQQHTETPAPVQPEPVVAPKPKVTVKAGPKPAPTPQPAPRAERQETPAERDSNSPEPRKTHDLHSVPTERPDWLTDGMTARDAMFAYLDRYPETSGAQLDREVGVPLFETKPGYGRKIRGEWIASRSPESTPSPESALRVVGEE